MLRHQFEEACKGGNIPRAKEILKELRVKGHEDFKWVRQIAILNGIREFIDTPLERADLYSICKAGRMDWFKEVDLSDEDLTLYMAARGACDGGHFEMLKHVLDLERDQEEEEEDNRSELIVHGPLEIARFVFEDSDKCEYCRINMASRLLYFGEFEEAEKLLENIDMDEYESDKPFIQMGEAGRTEHLEKYLSKVKDARRDSHIFDSLRGVLPSAQMDTMKMIFDKFPEEVKKLEECGYFFSGLVSESGNVEFYDFVKDKLPGFSKQRCFRDACSKGHMALMKHILPEIGRFCLEPGFRFANDNGYVEISHFLYQERELCFTKGREMIYYCQAQEIKSIFPDLPPWIPELLASYY